MHKLTRNELKPFVELGNEFVNRKAELDGWLTINVGILLVDNLYDYLVESDRQSGISLEIDKDSRTELCKAVGCSIGTLYAALDAIAYASVDSEGWEYPTDESLAQVNKLKNKKAASGTHKPPRPWYEVMSDEDELHTKLEGLTKAKRKKLFDSYYAQMKVYGYV